LPHYEGIDCAVAASGVGTPEVRERQFLCDVLLHDFVLFYDGFRWLSSETRGARP